MYGWIPPRSKKQPKRTPSYTVGQPPHVNLRLEQTREHNKQHPSVGDSVGCATKAVEVGYDDPLMDHREQLAKSVKHTIAPICNKGGYQLITSPADIKTAGRKV